MPDMDNTQETSALKCDRCGEPIPPGDETNHFGRTLCEECYMQALIPLHFSAPSRQERQQFMLLLGALGGSVWILYENQSHTLSAV